MKKVAYTLLFVFLFLLTSCRKINTIPMEKGLTDISNEKINYVSLDYNLFDDNIVKFTKENNIKEIIELLDHRNMLLFEYNDSYNNEELGKITEDKLKTAIQIAIYFKNGNCLKFIIKDDGGLFNNYKNKTSSGFLDGKVYTNKIYVYSKDVYNEFLRIYKGEVKVEETSGQSYKLTVIDDYNMLAEPLNSYYEAGSKVEVHLQMLSGCYNGIYMNGKHITEGNNPARICEKGHELHTFIMPEEDSVLYIAWNGLICKPENCPEHKFDEGRVSQVPGGGEELHYTCIKCGFIKSTEINKPTDNENTETEEVIVNLGDIEIIESAGHLENAYIEWKPIENIETYHVYYKAKDESVMSYKKLDMMLIRKYNNYYRADVVGLAGGEYNIKVTSVHNNQEVGSFTEVTLKVKSHDRSGFAFSTHSPLKDASGAYNSDGTLKDGAQVIYVHAGNAKTVTATVNGTQVTGFQAIIDAKAKKNTSNDILCFRIIGMISISDLDGTSSSAIGLQVKGNSANTNMNLTIEGIGEDAVFNGFGVLIRNCGNVEIRNIGFINFKDDGISVDTDNCNLWLHNNDFFYGSGGSGDKAKGDGALDIKKSHYCTVSYNHFWDSGKCNLLDASTGSGSDYMSYHHNWFDHSDSRHPRVRNASSVHVYNNYFDGVAKYGIGAAGGGSSVFSEANYFRNTLHPYLSSKQGTDALGDGTFSGEDGGIIKSYGDVIIGGNPVITYQENMTSFDIYLAQSKDETINSSIKSLSGGYTYSNFDTASTMYTYQIQSANEAKETVMMYAGRINQGDLQYDFNDTLEDENYSIIQELKLMVTNYKSSLVSILGSSDYSDSSSDSNSTNPDENDKNDQTSIEGTIVHNFTTSGKTSSIFTINGNLSTSKGTVIYEGITLTQCLKIESSTTIGFTIDKNCTLILVFKEIGKKIKVDGNSYTIDADGVVTVELSSGSHTITKGDSINLFYIVLKPIQ